MVVFKIRGWHVAVHEGASYGRCPSSRRIRARVSATAGDVPLEQGLSVELQRQYGGLRLRGLVGARYIPDSSRWNGVDVLVSEAEFGVGEPNLAGIVSGAYIPGIVAEFAPSVLDGAVAQLEQCQVRSGTITFDGGGYDRESSEVVFHLAAGVVIRRLEATHRKIDFEASVEQFLVESGY